MGHLKELEKELEAGMRGEAAGEAADEKRGGVKALSTDGATAAVEEVGEDRHFMAEADDFYPTDERMHPKK